MRILSKVIQVIGVIALTALQCSALNNGVGLTPPMGFNTFRAFGCNNYNETIIKQQAQLMVSLGLKDAGYTYMNIDDCWSLAQRDSNSHIQADPAKFPSGMASLGA